MIYIIYLVIFGLFLTSVLGLVASWIDRKVTARVQYRVGPPFFQPFIDITKLMGKEVVVPNTASKGMFFFAPLMSFAGAVVASTILWINQLGYTEGFLGDLFVVIYLLMIPSIGIMLGGLASGNPLARIGASREIKLMLSYELPFILSIASIIVRSNNSIILHRIIEIQTQNGANALSFSGGIALIVSIICIQAKLSFAPFDIPEAETEIMAGPLIEYSGIYLGLYKLTKSVLLFTLPFFIIILFLGGLNLSGIGIVYSIIKYIALLVIITLIRNTNPRVRIDQAMKFFWGPVTVAAIVSLVLAFIGL